MLLNQPIQSGKPEVSSVDIGTADFRTIGVSVLRLSKRNRRALNG